MITGEQDAAGIVDPRPQSRSTIHPQGRGLGFSTLRQAATRLADFRSPGNRFKTRDLVALLLSHGARSWRASQPAARVRVRVFAPDGHPAVRIDLDAPEITAR
ncbi:hypothetical protein [Mesorhizobium koreense]|uniref:hypothetical protein n=1 Tax=Mesorhizobium koreense TaxID=3074855 RepID=UPI00287B9C16|nr:hypothetical protein [Mesorhizobium sp. WR6]